MREVRWVGSSRHDLRRFPKEVQRNVGFALHISQSGGKAGFVKPLKGFGGASFFEVVEAFEGDAYRAVYTVRFANAIYVLHCFQKKSKRGIQTTKPDLELIKARLRSAEEDYKLWLENEPS